MSDNGSASTREQALATLRDHDKFLLTTHERPDGDAVGSLAAMQQVLTGARQGRGGVPDRRRVPAARTSTASSTLDGLVTEPPRGPVRAR